MLILLILNGKQNFLVCFVIYTFIILNNNIFHYVIISVAWPERSRQILKKWRTLSPEQKGPFLLKARENRTNLRQKKAQQVSVKIINCFWWVILIMLSSIS